MAIINYKPTTPSRRNMSCTDYSGLSKVAPEKSLLAPLNKKSGRNSYGRITVRHRAAETEENTVSSILNVQNTAFQLLYKH